MRTRGQNRRATGEWRALRLLRRGGHGQLSEPWTKDEEDEPAVNDVSSPPPACGDASDTGVVNARDEDDDGEVLDVTGVAVD